MAGMIRRLFALAFLAAISGCASRQYYTDADNPEIVVTLSGSVTYRGKIVDPEDLPDLLEDSDYPKQSTVNIQVAEGLTDYRIPSKVMGILRRNGYRRSIFIGEKRSYSTVGKGEPTHRKAVPIGPKANSGTAPVQYNEQVAPSPVQQPFGAQSTAPAKRTIRYKQ